MVIAFKAIIAERFKLAVKHASAISAARNANARRIREIVGASGNDNDSRTYVDAALVDMIPFVEAFGWLGVVDFYFYRHFHIANGTHPDRAWSNGQQAICRFFSPAFAEIAENGLVLEIKLVIIGEQIEMVLFNRPHNVGIQSGKTRLRFNVYAFHKRSRV